MSSNNENIFKYEYAVVCKSVPNSIKEGLCLDENHSEVNVAIASEQHAKYLKLLKTFGLKLIEIEANEEFQDCVFVEDLVVSIGNKICILNLKAESRRGETSALEKALENFEDKHLFEIYTLKDKMDVYVDGGDCCFTGRELLVGLSTRTNKKGADELAKVFSNIKVTTLNVTKYLHLKSVLTMAGNDTIIINSSPEAQLVRKQLENESEFYKFYKFIELPDYSANVLLINSKIVYPACFREAYESHEYFQDKTKYAMETSEFAKVDGALTCRSILLSSQKFS